MDLLKMAVRMNFLAAGLFVINSAYSFYNGQSEYWKYIVLSLLFVALGFFYRRKLKRKSSES